MLIVLFLALANVSLSYTQTTDVSTLSYQAFNQLASVYRLGGSAPDLVSRLNFALSLMEIARLERAQGNAGDASALEGQVRSMIEQVSNQIPAAQQQAAQASNLRVQTTIGAGALVVALLTLCFYGSIRIWRWYEKEKLFEMKIIADQAKD